jgi:hypothetical protein
MIWVYNCSRCNARVSETATRCPSCGAIFSNRVQGGWNDRAGGNQPGGNQPGAGATLLAASNPPKPASSKRSDSSEEGLDWRVILAISVGGIILLGGLAAIIVMSQQGTRKPRRRKRSLSLARDYD